MTIIDALSDLLKGHEWTLHGDTLDGLTVHDGTQAPTQMQVDAWFAEHDHELKRRIEYPYITELADALVHQYQGDGGAALKVYFEKCVEVKKKYPKEG